MSQKTAWEQEYTQEKGVPTSTRTKPSSAVVRLTEYIQTHNLSIGKHALDVGCGAGRNSIYLAQQGFQVTAIDFARPALDRMQTTIQNERLEDQITAQQCDLTGQLPFDDNSFDCAIDIVSTISLTPEEMRNLEQELRRIVKPGGLFLTYVHSRDDGYLAEAAPGRTSYTIEGLTDHTWAEEELRKLYEKWEVLALDKTEKLDDFYGKQYTRRIWWMLLKNSK